MLSNTDLPQTTAFTIDLKLSSKITISEASLATAVDNDQCESQRH